MPVTKKRNWNEKWTMAEPMRHVHVKFFYLPPFSSNSIINCYYVPLIFVVIIDLTYKKWILVYKIVEHRYNLIMPTGDQILPIYACYVPRIKSFDWCTRCAFLFRYLYYKYICEWENFTVLLLKHDLFVFVFRGFVKVVAHKYIANWTQHIEERKKR